MLRRRTALLGAAAALAGGKAVAQSAPGSWPSRTVRVIVPYPAGGTADIAARLFFASVSSRLSTV
jgi:tripartite-type tricarboxylate transporter receptor subunit TctC